MDVSGFHCIMLFILALGLLDFCPEEIRLEAYTANAKGNADIYVRIASHSIFPRTHCICENEVAFI